MNGLVLLSILYLTYGVSLYSFSTIMYMIQSPWYMDRIEKFSPIMGRSKKPYWYKLVIFFGCWIVALLIGLGLWHGYWWAIIAALAISANETYRGATHYMKSKLYQEAKQHMIIHGFICGYIICYVLFVKLNAVVHSFISGTYSMIKSFLLGILGW